MEKEVSGSSEEDIEYQSGEDQSDNNSDVGDNQNTHKDGLADMMSKILNQQVGTKAPILAKRKTSIMKEIDHQKEQLESIKKAKIQKKQQQEKQMVQPSLSTMNYEKQLKKLATKGVVALFNAISKAKVESQALAAKDDHVEHQSEESTQTAVKKMTRENFLSLLSNTNKGGTSMDETNEKKILKKDLKSKDRAKKDSSVPSPAWKAVQSDLHTAKKPTLKDWDREDENEVDTSPFSRI